MTVPAADQYYCNQKFWWLTVNLEKLNTSSCCSATPQPLNLDWLTQHPGQLFNSPDMQSDRKRMLANEPVESCEANCWRPEQQQLPSRRTIMFGNQRTHESIQSTPKILNIVVGSDCNLTCVYCCKFYSTAWTRDIIKKPYPVNVADDRFTINSVDTVLANVSQKVLSQSSKRIQLIQEVQKLYHSDKLEEICITGGEPFLYLDLLPMLQLIPSHVKVKIWSGLGVSESRFKKIIDNLPSNVNVVVSAENIEQQYEFARYGNTWQRFQQNIDILKSSGIRYEFMATVSNITIFGLPKFIEYARDIKITYSPCFDPDFLSVSVLDAESKNLIKPYKDALPDFVSEALEVDPTPDQVYNLKSYIKEFAARRSLDLKIFPKSFSTWVEL